MPEKKIYKGNVEITKDNVSEWEEKLRGIDEISGYLSINSNASLKALKSVGGYLSINSNASLKAEALKSVGGYISINSKLGLKLEKQLWKYNHKRRWYMTDKCSEWLLKREGEIAYRIDNVGFDIKLFDMIRKDELPASEVFAITNIEQRRIAYARMDKTKMKDLPNLKIIDEVQNDGQGYPMKLISFEIQGFNKPFKFLNCFCPSTKREYFLETQEDTCSQAKAKSFGLDEEKAEFACEW